MSQESKRFNALLWSVGDVASHLFEEEVDESTMLLFMEKDIDGKHLLSLTEDELLEMGLGKEERSSLLHLIHELSSCSPSSSPSSIPSSFPSSFPCSSSSSCSSSSLPMHQGALRHDPTNHGGPSGFGVCDLHGQTLDYYCESCDALSCAECLVDQHPRHSLLLFEECGDALRRELGGFVEKLSTQSSHIEKVLKECGVALDTLARTTLASLQEIESVRDKLVKSIIDSSESAIVQTKEYDASKRAYLRRKVEENLALKKDVDALQQDLSQLLKECSPALVMQRRDSFKASCSELLGETRAQSIAQLNLIFSVQALVGANGAVNSILELVWGPLFNIQMNGNSLVTQGLSACLGRALVPSSVCRIVAVGGLGLDTAELYDSRSNSWVRLPSMRSKRGRYPAIGYFNNKIYVAGGYDGVFFAFAEMLDLSAGRWVALPSMKVARGCTGGVFLVEKPEFLVVGGRDGKAMSLPSCEAFDTVSNMWTLVASLNYPRSAHCVVLYKDKPVALGGYGIGNASLNTCETYDSVSNKWILFPAFNRPRVYFGAAVVREHIYIVGGGKKEDSIEVFDGTLWIMMSVRLAQPRSCIAATCILNKLVVLGGRYSDATEVYDPSTNTISPTSMPKMKISPVRSCLALVSF